MKYLGECEENLRVLVFPPHFFIAAESSNTMTVGMPSRFGPASNPGRRRWRAAMVNNGVSYNSKRQEFWR
jgi:hypothetical protein